MRLVSTNAKIKQLEGLLGTADLGDWEQGFVENIVEVTNGGENVSGLSDRRLEKIDQIWKKHFA